LKNVSVIYRVDGKNIDEIRLVEMVDVDEFLIERCVVMYMISENGSSCWMKRIIDRRE
jgi:hypothetical protein